MLKTTLTIKALNFAYQKHHGQVDKAGMPYIFHPYEVSKQLNDEDATIVALLHDVLEDTDATIDDLKELGLSNHVIKAIVTLTHDNSMTYKEYIENIRLNPLARLVKINDLRHNLDIKRLRHVTKKDLERVEKYKKALERLEEN